RFSRRRPPEGLAEIEVGGVVRRQQTLLALLLLRRAPAGELDASPLGERPQGLCGREAVLLLQPGKDIALLATSKTVVGTPVGIDVECRRLLGVEGAYPDVRAAGLLDRDSLADELDDADALFDGVA